MSKNNYEFSTICVRIKIIFNHFSTLLFIITSKTLKYNHCHEKHYKLVEFIPLNDNIWYN